MSYKDIEFDSSDKVCCSCGIKLEEGESPWNVSYDPEYKVNVWGGDTYEFKGSLCQSCAESLSE